MNIQQRLQEMEATLSNPLEKLNVFRPPADWKNLTQQEKERLISDVEITREWVNTVAMPHFETMEVTVKDMNDLSDGLRARYQKYKENHQVVFTLGNGIQLVFDSCKAVISKTNEVMMTVIFEKRVWSDTISPVMAAMAALITAVFISECLSGSY